MPVSERNYCIVSDLTKLRLAGQLLADLNYPHIGQLTVVEEESLRNAKKAVAEFAIKLEKLIR